MTHERTTGNQANPVAVATVIQVQAPTSAKPGDKALISADGTIEGWVGGGCVQPAVISVVDKVVDSGQPCLLRVAPNGLWSPVDGLTDYSSSCLGRGAFLLFVEPLHTQPTLCIMGESVVALSLAEQSLRMNLNIVLQAPAMQKEPISSSIVVQTEFSPIPKTDYIVIATQGKGDKKAIDAALKSECPHIRMVVSERKLVALKEQLRKDGFKNTSLERLEGPAGIRIGAQLPDEIALSVLAEIIQLRRTVSTESERPAVNVAVKPGADCCGG